MGDFNCITDPQDKRGGSPFTYSVSVRDFQSFIQYTNLTDLGFVGQPFTWCNMRDGPAHILERIDRGFASDGLTSFLIGSYPIFLGLGQTTTLSFSLKLSLLLVLTDSFVMRTWGIPTPILNLGPGTTSLLFRVIFQKSFTPCPRLSLLGTTSLSRTYFRNFLVFVIASKVSKPPPPITCPSSCRVWRKELLNHHALKLQQVEIFFGPNVRG